MTQRPLHAEIFLWVVVLYECACVCTNITAYCVWIAPGTVSMDRVSVLTVAVHLNESWRWRADGHTWRRGVLFRRGFLYLVPLMAVSMPVMTNARRRWEYAHLNNICSKNGGFDWCIREKKEQNEQRWWKRGIHLVRSSISTSMASCSTCSSSLNSSNCTSSSFRPVLQSGKTQS